MLMHIYYIIYLPLKAIDVPVTHVSLTVWYESRDINTNKTMFATFLHVIAAVHKVKGHYERK